MEKNPNKTSVIIRDVGSALVAGLVVLLLTFIMCTTNPLIVYVYPFFDSLSIAIPYTLGLLFSVFFKNAPEKFGKKSFITTIIFVGILSIVIPTALYTIILYTEFWVSLSMRSVLQFSIGFCVHLNKIVYRYFLNNNVQK